MGRPLGRKNMRSYIGADELDRLRINPIEEAIKTLAELDKLIEMNVLAYQSGRGLTEKGDAGPQYLANAVRCVSEKKETYMTLAKFKYPTLSAIAIKDMTDRNENKEPMTTAEAIKVIQSDPFRPKEVKSEDIVHAITDVREMTVLVPGDANDRDNNK